MTLPEGFSEWEHLQSTVTRFFNKLVREEFSELGDETWDPDISIPRGSLRHACTIKDDDTNAMLILRYLLFYITLRKARDMQQIVVGNPKGAVDAGRRYRPQVGFYFREDEADVDAEYEPIAGQISYRLIDETSETVTQTELNSLAARIKAEFGTGQGYVWKKGKDMGTYRDYAKGYDFRILCRTETDAKELISKVLDTNNDNPDWKYFHYKVADQPTSAYPTIPDNQSILGKITKEPRKRPIANVRFQYSYLNLWGKTKPIYLYDRTLMFPEAIENS